MEMFIEEITNGGLFAFSYKVLQRFTASREIDTREILLELERRTGKEFRARWAGDGCNCYMYSSGNTYCEYPNGSISLCH